VIPLVAYLAVVAGVYLIVGTLPAVLVTCGLLGLALCWGNLRTFGDSGSGIYWPLIFACFLSLVVGALWMVM
jgi:hypothetical protein